VTRQQGEIKSERSDVGKIIGFKRDYALERNLVRLYAALRPDDDSAIGLVLDQLTHPEYRRMALAIKEHKARAGHVEWHALLQDFPEQAQTLSAWAVEGEQLSQERGLKLAQDVLRQWERKQLKLQLEHLTGEIQVAEQMGRLDVVEAKVAEKQVRLSRWRELQNAENT
jgi:hypothetical protein